MRLHRDDGPCPLDVGQAIARGRYGVSNYADVCGNRACGDAGVERCSRCFVRSAGSGVRLFPSGSRFYFGEQGNVGKGPFAAFVVLSCTGGDRRRGGCRQYGGQVGKRMGGVPARCFRMGVRSRHAGVVFRLGEAGG